MGSGGGVVLFQLLAPLLLLALQDVAGQQLPLGVGHVGEFGADLEAALRARVAMGDLAAQQQAVGARHQHHLHLHPGAGGNRCGLCELDAALGNDHRLGLANFAEQGLGNYCAKQVEAFVLCAQESGEGAVLLAQLAQQVLRLEVGQVQLAEQVEQRRIILQHIWVKGFGRAEGADLKCDPIFDAVVFAAIFFV